MVNNFWKAFLVVAVLGYASAFSPTCKIISLKSRGPMTTRVSMIGNRGDNRDETFPEAPKVSPATSRRDWMANVMKGIGAVAVGIIMPTF
jgi:hypothetical protein